MADTRTVVLVLSPKAAEAVEDALTERRAAMGPEWASGDEEVIAECDLLEQVRDELRAQRGNLAPDEAKQLAERMAKAGLDAVAA